jgi:hypothetical protein
MLQVLSDELPFECFDNRSVLNAVPSKWSNIASGHLTFAVGIRIQIAA